MEERSARCVLLRMLCVFAPLTLVAGVMSFPVQELTTYTLPQPIDSMKTLYARHFYPALLREVRAAKKVVLIGNAGTAKSTIQFYVLKVLLDAHDGLTTLPPDCWGSTMPFDVVVREVADLSTEVYFLKEGKAHVLDYP